MRTILLALMILLLTGCSSIGPSRIKADRQSYNDIVRQTDFQQVLTNIVHLAYVEPTQYLRVTNITASYSLNAHLNASATWHDGVGNHSYGIEPGASYSDSPTISYVPVDDEKFVRMMYQPVTFDDITLLFNGGVNDIAVLTRLAFNRVGNLDNASSATSPKMMSAPHYQQYYQFVRLLVVLLKNQQATITPAKIHNRLGLVLNFSRKSVNATQAVALKKLLGVPSHSRNIIFVSRNVIRMKQVNSHLVPSDYLSHLHNVVYVQTRSANSMLAFLSHSVDIPTQDIQSHLVPRQFETASIMQGLMHIYSSDTKPTNAFVRVYVNHHWFYISNSDITSKETFTILIRLMTLIAGYDDQSNQQLAPVITVPVGATRT